MQFLQQLENGFHVLLPQVEAGVTQILVKVGDRHILHRILQTGEVISNDVNIPMLRLILQAIDSAIPA